MRQKNLWLARVFIGTVTLFNVQCAVVFLLTPQQYSAGFEVSGVAGEALVRGMGILFLMWNVPYVVAFWHPVRMRVSLYSAAAMQAIGLIGESWLFIRMPEGHAMLRQTALRFIVFDAAGLILLGAAMALVYVQVKKQEKA